MKIRKFSSIGKIVRRDSNRLRYNCRQMELRRMSTGRVRYVARYQDHKNGAIYLGHFPLNDGMLQDRKAEARGGYPF